MLKARAFTAIEYFRTHAQDGRAPILYHSKPGYDGMPEMRLWLCMLKDTLVACDDVGPDHINERDYGYIQQVPYDLLVSAVILQWKDSRVRVLARRQAQRQRARYILRSTPNTSPHAS